MSKPLRDQTKPIRLMIAIVIDPQAMDDRIPQAAVHPSPRDLALDKADLILRLMGGCPTPAMVMALKNTIDKQLLEAGLQTSITPELARLAFIAAIEAA